MKVGATCRAAPSSRHQRLRRAKVPPVGTRQHGSQPCAGSRDLRLAARLVRPVPNRRNRFAANDLGAI
jgi:hypothetical protein